MGPRVRILAVTGIMVLSARAGEPVHSDFGRCLVDATFARVELPRNSRAPELIPFAGSYFPVPRHFVAAAKSIFFQDASLLQKALDLQALVEMTHPRSLKKEEKNYADIARLNRILVAAEDPINYEQPEVNLIIHQDAQLQEASADFLGTKNLAGKPTITVASPWFSVPSDRLQERTDVIQYSEDGHLSWVPHATNTFNLFGGRSEQCVSNAIGSIFGLKYGQPHAPPVEVYFYPTHSYTEKPDPRNSRNPAPRPVISTVDDVKRLFIRSGFTAQMPSSAQVSEPVYEHGPRGPAYRMRITAPPPYTREMSVIVLAR